MASLTILHFNDVYNIEGQKDEPQGGAARMKTYIDSQQQLNPLVLFSGDALNPSLMSIFLKGEQMVPVLKELGVKAAVYGNHDFDFGVDHLEDIANRCNFPWLLSNVKDMKNNSPLANGEQYAIIDHAGIKIGIIGLVEEEWIDTLSTLDPDDLLFVSFIETGEHLSRMLRQMGAELIIALTHMRVPNDVKLAENVPEIDIILGGHDHDYEIINVNGKQIIKSGTDFRNMSKLTLTQINDSNGWEVDVECVNLDSSIKEDEALKRIVEKSLGCIEGKMDTCLGSMNVEMDGRFSSIRTQETNLGNFVTDVILTGTKADVALINSGTFRSDRVHPKGEFKIRDLLTIFPLVDELVVIKCTGSQLIEALENSVSKYPVKEGRFLQVAGIFFGFNPTLRPGKRVAHELVKVQGEFVNPDSEYLVATKEYIANGKDGFDVFKNCEIVTSAEQCTTLSTIMQNHFEAIQEIQGLKTSKSGHRQCLIPLKKREHLTKELILDKVDGTSYHSHPVKLVRQESIHELEKDQSYLCPKIDGRIIMLTDEKRHIMQTFTSMIPRNVSMVMEESTSGPPSSDMSGDES